ncbi:MULTISPECIES: hypothetical protein [Nostocales]|uniref:Uncharacterized protein n=2 Tax=Nostocales TaxID=1161 RepID=A0A8S9SXR0_9CYAN|nr:hypothetical protein DA73_0400033870 [Tolypothrix bouteillei VB521301]
MDDKDLYEYGYKYLNPWFCFTAGWMFLLAKTASAATAALGFASYTVSFTCEELQRSIARVPLQSPSLTVKKLPNQRKQSHLKL